MANHLSILLSKLVALKGLKERKAEENNKKQINGGNNDNTDQQIETVATDQTNGDEEQINTMQKPEDPAEESKDHDVSQQTRSYKNNDEESKDSQ